MEVTATMAMREAFGAASDLDLDFAAPRPRLVAALLAGSGDAEAWRRRPVGERVAALLHFCRAHLETNELELAARCGSAECGETFGFALPIDELAALPTLREPLRVTLPEGRAVTLRAPLGVDLERWRAARPASREEAARIMLADLVVDGRAEPQDEAAIAEAMSAADPLTALTVAAACPACGRAQSVAVDVEGLALAHFARRRQTLLRDIHRLAAHYGWTEAQCLAVPPARRAAYLALIEGEAS